LREGCGTGHSRYAAGRRLGYAAELGYEIDMS